MDSFKPEQDLIVIGGGPKGLAMHCAAQRSGLNSLLLEVGRLGQSWEKSRVSPTLPIRPPNLEIIGDEAQGFKAYLSSSEAQKLLASHPIPESGPCALHFHAYLQWLKDKTPNIQEATPCQRLTKKEDYYQINGVWKTRNVVVATGQIGYGKDEFSYDATQKADTKFVAHTPAHVRDEAGYREFLGAAEEIAIVGANAGALGALFTLNEINFTGKVHLIGQYNAKAELLQELQRQGWALEKLQNSSFSIQYHNHGSVVNAEVEAKHVLLDLINHTRLTVERCLVATGYRFDVSKIPFLQELINTGALLLSDNKRYPKLQSDFSAQSEDELSGLFFMGTAAVAVNPQERWLESTRETVNTILKAIGERASDHQRSTFTSSGSSPVSVMYF
ncbi:NAD(P)-binding domain-containing protein [Candidatus Peregrinibacteria bacterium]|nr:MAG: NAD(P)-binding domain-containing protein [Candidatus Peregrinibacteria bacterium]